MTLPTTASRLPVVEVPVADVHGRQLRLVLGCTPSVAVATRSWSLPDGSTVVAEVLAASHRVTVTGPATDVGLVETVACDLGGPAPVDAYRLPRHHRCASHGRTFEFTSDLVCGAAEVAALARRLHARHDDPDTLSVRFPGHADALTAIEISRPRSTPGATPDITPDIGWSTWHLYPGAEPHAVLTTTVVGAITPDASIRR